MPLLFSYGALQREHLQLSTCGRLLDGQKDELVRYAPALFTRRLFSPGGDKD